jgi:hypothetical protein
MRQAKHLVATVALGFLGVALWLAVRAGAPGGPPTPGPSRANFGRVRAGMSLTEVEAVLGPAGPSYSSLRSLGVPHKSYYIWKGRDGWSRVWIVNDRVTDLAFDADLSVDD